MTDPEKIFIITSRVEAGTVETMPEAPEMVLIRNEDLEHSNRYFREDEKVCITSEYSLAAVTARLDPCRKNAVEILKNKFRFRTMLSEIYPEYQFRSLKFNDIRTLHVDKKSVIKPVRGIFGTAVRIVGPETDFSALSMELTEEIRKNARVYPDSVLSSEEFMLEDYIHGEEYAVDMFYDSAGNPCIVNIMHHPLPANQAYIHMMYNASKSAFDAVYQPAKAFFTELNKILKVTRFVMHTELRLWKGKIYPVEVNTMRFGGMGLCNLVWHSLRINPFLCYLSDREPDFNLAWKGKENRIYSFFIAYNGAGIDKHTTRPMPEKLKEKFTQVILEQPFDHQRQLAFGIYFLEEREENIPELLNIDFNDYFEPV